MKTTTTADHKIRLTITPWEFKILANALAKYGPDSPQAAEFPEEFWTFSRAVRQDIELYDFMEEIQKPTDLGLAGPFPKIQ